VILRLRRTVAAGSGLNDARSSINLMTANVNNFTARRSRFLAASLPGVFETIHQHCDFHILSILEAQT